jgi:hypothetical protein
MIIMYKKIRFHKRLPKYFLQIQNLFYQFKSESSNLIQTVLVYGIIVKYYFENSFFCRNMEFNQSFSNKVSVLINQFTLFVTIQIDFLYSFTKIVIYI